MTHHQIEPKSGGDDDAPLQDLAPRRCLNLEAREDALPEDRDD